MGMKLGVIALAMAVSTASDAGRVGAPIQYKVRFIEVEGLGWRDAVLARLAPVTRQGAATVWTAPSDVAKRVVACASKAPSGQMLQTPTVTAWSGRPAHITTRSDRRLVTQVSWDGTVAKPESVPTGSAATIAGRKLDQGILVQMVLQDTQILAVHRVALSDPRNPEVLKVAAHEQGACPTAVTAAAHDCCPAETTCHACPKDAALKKASVAVEVPEIGSQEIAGEWLIPKDGVLLVSFGPHTVAGRDGKAEIRERLAIVEAEEATTPAAHAAAWGAPAFSVPVVPAPSATPAPAPPAIATAPAGKLPPVPARSIPQGYHADGKAAELPPLPPEETHIEADDSDEAHATPQSKQPRKIEAPKPQPQPAADPATKKAQFSAPGSFPVIPTLFQPMPTVGLQFLVPIKPISLKLPFNRRLEVEIYGRVIRAPQADTTDLATTDRPTTK